MPKNFHIGRSIRRSIPRVRNPIAPIRRNVVRPGVRATTSVANSVGKALNKFRKGKVMF
jgi:hypothetical protein